MTVFQRIGASHLLSLMLIFGKKFNNVHGDVIYHIMFLMHLRLSLLILWYILLIEAKYVCACLCVCARARVCVCVCVIFHFAPIVATKFSIN
jgi:hypothetical protein